MIKKLIKTKYAKEKSKFLLLSFLVLFVIIFLIINVSSIYAKYVTDAKLKSNIDKALYIINNDKLSFDIDPDRIVPSDKGYEYKFSVNNFKGDKSSDIDLDYYIEVITTTNLPIDIKLYRNENYSPTATNKLSTAISKKDLGEAFYRFYKTDVYSLFYANNTTDIYTLVVVFPKVYGKDTTYASQIENIQINIKSSQKVN